MLQARRMHPAALCGRGVAVSKGLTSLAVPRNLHSARHAQSAHSKASSACVRVQTAQTTAAPTAVLTSNKTDTADSGAKSKKTFSWTKAWYPAVCVDNLDLDKPNTFQLLGKEYIVWADSTGKWHCFLDRCPHRLSPLSGGFIDRSRDEVVCAYHGWRFKADGSCSTIPQAPNAKVAATACGSQRSCATAFPTQEAGGLLWVWPDGSKDAAAQADAAPLPLPADLLDERLSPLRGRWFQRDMPCSWDFFIENVMDPTHIDFAHHGVAGYDATNPVNYELKLLEDRGPAGFVIQALPTDPKLRRPVGTFRPPCNVMITPGEDPVDSSNMPTGATSLEIRPGSTNPNVCTTVAFYAYPSKPGWTRVYIATYITDRSGKLFNSISMFDSSIPAWIKHMLKFEFFAGDDMLLGAASRGYAAEGFNWRHSYYMPTSADLSIGKIRQWLDEYSGGVIPFPSHMQGERPILDNLNITPRQALDRYTQHVQHCSHCRAALAKTQATATAAAVAAVTSVVGAVLVASIRATAALSPNTVPMWLSGVVSWGAPGVLGLSGPLLVAGALAVVAYCSAKKLEGWFHYREFKRPIY